MENLIAVRKQLQRLERALLKADAVIREPVELDADDRMWLRARMAKQLRVWLAQLEGPPA